MLAEDTLLGRRVALKRIHTPDDVAARSRLRREALIGASLGHPNLVSIYDIVTTEDGEEVIVMEYVEGETLADRLRRGQKPDIPATLMILEGVSRALDAIHERRIVHRDVKPANILLGADGVVKLADLGVAAVPDRSQLTTTGAVVGTFRYMAPEQLEGSRATPAVDVYALAAVAFEALSGEKARHEPNPMALAHAIATQPPPDLRKAWPGAPAEAAQVLMGAMSRDPEARPRSAGELIARLKTALQPEPARRPEPVMAISRSGRSRVPLAALATALVAVIAVVAIALANSGKPKSHPAIARVNPAVSAGSAHPAKRASGSRHHSTSGSTNASTSASSHAAASQPPQSRPIVSLPGPASALQPAGAGSPAGAVETFYHLAAAHQFAQAWTLADPAFRQQMLGLQGLESTMSHTRSVTFDSANVVNQSASNAVVFVRTTSVQDSGTQQCSGPVNLVRAAGTTSGWLLDHIAITCA